MTGTVAHPNWKKLFIQMSVGAVIGAAASFVVLFAWEGRGLDTSDPAQMVAFAAGLIYVLIGLMVGFGAFAPSAGAKFLNVEDEEELRDQRPVLRLGAISSVLIGLLFLVLAMVPAGGEGGLLGREAAAAIAGGCLLILIVLTLRTNRMVDELTRQVSMEASSLTMQVGFVLFGGWAALAHLGFVEWISPLAFVAGMALLQLLLIFWVAARRGLIVVPEKSAG